jgi:hypothetical protein
MALQGRIDFTEDEIDDFSHYLRFFSRSKNNFTLLATGVPVNEIQNSHHSTYGKSEIIIEGKSYDCDKISDALFCTGIPVVENILDVQKEWKNQ